jgi:hypothetical protein
VDAGDNERSLPCARKNQNRKFSVRKLSCQKNTVN